MTNIGPASLYGLAGPMFVIPYCKIRKKVGLFILFPGVFAPVTVTCAESLVSFTIAKAHAEDVAFHGEIDDSNLGSLICLFHVSFLIGVEFGEMITSR